MCPYPHHLALFSKSGKLSGALCPQTPSLIPLIYSQIQHTHRCQSVCLYVCVYMSVHTLLSNLYNSYSHMSIFQYFNIPIYINQSLHHMPTYNCPSLQCKHSAPPIPHPEPTTPVIIKIHNKSQNSTQLIHFSPNFNLYAFATSSPTLLLSRYHTHHISS